MRAAWVRPWRRRHSARALGRWDGRAIRVPLAGLGSELSAAIVALESIPGGVEGVRLREATLEEVFLRLTGRELRE